MQGGEGISDKVTDAVKAELKVTVSKKEPQPKVTLIIAREREVGEFRVGKRRNGEPGSI
jgi:hypothetical protein